MAGTMSVVAITGVSGYIGGRLLQLLAQDDRVARIVGVDVRPPTVAPATLRFCRHDITEPFADLFCDHGVTHAVRPALPGVCRQPPGGRTEDPPAGDRHWPPRRQLHLADHAAAHGVRRRRRGPAAAVRAQDDVARAFHALLFAGRGGAYNVAGDGVLALSAVAALLGARVRPLPYGLLRAMAALFWRLRMKGLGDAPPGMLQYVRYPMLMANEKIKREIGFRFDYTAEQALQASAHSQRER